MSAAILHVNQDEMFLPQLTLKVVEMEMGSREWKESLGEYLGLKKAAVAVKRGLLEWKVGWGWMGVVELSLVLGWWEVMV